MPPVICSNSPVEETFSALDLVPFLPVLKCFWSDALFVDGSTGEIFVSRDAMFLEESETAAAGTVSMAVHTPATSTANCESTSRFSQTSQCTE